jgi:hypothetical protein
MGITLRHNNNVLFFGVTDFFFSETTEQVSMKVMPKIRCCVVDLIFSLVGKSVFVRNLMDFMGNGTSNNFDKR